MDNSVDTTQPDMWMTAVNNLMEETSNGKVLWRVAKAAPVVPALGRVEKTFTLETDGHRYLLQRALSDAIPEGAENIWLVDTDIAEQTKTVFPRIRKLKALFDIVNTKPVIQTYRSLSGKPRKVALKRS